MLIRSAYQRNEIIQLDVGADRIARTATAALSLLAQIRVLTKQAIPLAWSPEIAKHSAIEVYPAGTLTAYGLPNGGYKDKSAEHRRVREQIIRGYRIGSRWPTKVHCLPMPMC